MKSVTIDRLPARVHERYAQDQNSLDTIYHTEPSRVAAHTESVGMSPIYASQLSTLFHMEPTYAPWAYFCPPPFFSLKRKKCFSHTLIPGVDDDVEQLDIDTGETSIQSEKQRLALFALLEEMGRVNRMLGQIHAEKMRYQKG